jgi:hypothetical protein
MRKGRLVKYKNYSNNSIDWERFSSGNGCWIEVRAYLDARDMKTFAATAESSDRNHDTFKRGFATIEEAFEWAESQVDYKKGIIKKQR